MTVNSNTNKEIPKDALFRDFDILSNDKEIKIVSAFGNKKISLNKKIYKKQILSMTFYFNFWNES